MGFIQEVEKFMVEKKEIQKDIEFIMGFFNYVELCADKDAGVDEVDLPEEVDIELLNIAERRDIESFEGLYWNIVSILYPFYPEHFADKDKQALVENADRITNLLNVFELGILAAKKDVWNTSNK